MIKVWANQNSDRWELIQVLWIQWVNHNFEAVITYVLWLKKAFETKKTLPENSLIWNKTIRFLIQQRQQLLQQLRQLYFARPLCISLANGFNTIAFTRDMFRLTRLSAELRLSAKDVEHLHLGFGYDWISQDISSLLYSSIHLRLWCFLVVAKCHSFVVKTWGLKMSKLGRRSQNMSQDAGLIKGGELYLNISHCAMAHDCLVVCCGSNKGFFAAARSRNSYCILNETAVAQKDSREFANFGDLYAKQL